MRILSLAGIAFATALGLVSKPVEAAPVFFNFSYVEATSAPNIGDFSGQFGVDDGVITSISGTGISLGSITGLLAPGTFPIGSPNDNLFNAAGPFLDFNGVSFATTSFGDVNLYRSGQDYNVLSDDVASVGSLEVSAVQAFVSEPASLALLGAGLIGIGVARRRRAA